METSVFAAGLNQDIQTIYVGNEKQPLLKVDSLFEGVDVIRDYAVQHNQFRAADSFYPGIRMEIHPSYTLAVLKSLAYFIQEFFNLDMRKVRKAASRYSIVTTDPRNLTLMQKIPHFDAPNPNSLAMIYYLCDAPDSGTALYRHLASGFEYINDNRYKTYLDTVRKQFSAPEQHPCGYIYKSTPEYEQIASYGACYNRLVAYHGSSLHSGIITPDYHFDPNPKTGRLTITSFIEFDN